MNHNPTLSQTPTCFSDPVFTVTPTAPPHPPRLWPCGTGPAKASRPAAASAAKACKGSVLRTPPVARVSVGRAVGMGGQRSVRRFASTNPGVAIGREWHLEWEGPSRHEYEIGMASSKSFFALLSYTSG